METEIFLCFITMLRPFGAPYAGTREVEARGTEVQGQLWLHSSSQPQLHETSGVRGRREREGEKMSVPELIHSLSWSAWPCR